MKWAPIADKTMLPIKMNFIAFSFQLKFENLKDRSGSLDAIRNAKRRISPTRTSLLKGCVSVNNKTLNQNKPFAGTGSPLNPVDFEVSKLKRANLNAAATAKRKAKAAHNFISGCRRRYSQNAGTTPKLTTSASESNCFPSSEAAPMARATNPSNKSAKAAISTKIKAS